MTVKALTGIPINYMITVNFRAFTNIVDKVGGVYMDVDHRYFNDNAGVATGGTYEKIDLHPGYQKLEGKEALDFVRFRHTDSDLYRVVRQQEFVKALKQRISTAWDIFQLPGIVKAVTENIEVGKGGGKELSASEVLKYANLAYTLPAGNFQQVPLDGVSGYSELTVPESSIDAAVRRFMNPDVKAPEKAIAVATGKKPKGETAPPPSEVGVEIVNGNGVAGAADEATVLLGQIGYVADNGGNADNFDYFRTKVQYEPEIPKSEGGGAGDGRPLRRGRRRACAGERPADDDAPRRPRQDVRRDARPGARRRHAGAPGAPDRQGLGLDRAGAPRAQEAARLPRARADSAGEQLVHRRRRRHPPVQDRRRQVAAAHVPHELERVLGHPADELGGPAHPRRADA